MAADVDDRLVPGPSVEAVIGDPAVSRTLKVVLRDWLRRDPIDAGKDAELLAAVLSRRADALLRSSP